MTEKILFVGRFQPFHNGHLSVVKEIVSNSEKELVIGIWTPNNEFLTQENPFTFTERNQIIVSALQKEWINLDIVWIPDFRNNDIWGKYIETNIKPSKVVSWNQVVNSIFSDKLWEIKQRYEDISATLIRNLIMQQGDFSSYVPWSVSNYIYENWLYGRILAIKEWMKLLNPEYYIWETQKDLFLHELKEKELEFYANNPLLATDAVIIKNNQILLIERKNYPYGWALPGGFVDKWESLQQAVLRELKEELNLEWEIIKQVGIYDDPKRDPRGHTISVAYRIQASGIPKAQDDAKSFEWINIEDIKNGKIKLAFDHKKIILDAL